MDKNLIDLIVQKALTELLAEKRFLLNDGKALMTELRKHVAPEHSMKLSFFQNALVDANIGEVLMLADEADEEARDKAKAEAMARLNNMQKDIAVYVVQTLTKAMEWPSPESTERKFFPEDKSQTSKTTDKTAVDYYNYGVTAVSKKKYNKALKNFSKAIEMNPEFTDAYDKRAMVYAQMGQYEEAILDYSEVIKQDSKNAFAYYERGMCYYGLEKYKNALDDFNKAAQLAPNDENISRMQTLLRKKSAVTEDDTKVKTAVDYHNEGFEALSQKKYDKALEDFNKAIELDPKYIVAYFRRALTYHNKGNYDAAIADFTKAIELNPKYSKAYSSRGLTYFNKKDYNQAIVNFTKVIELNLDDADAYNSRGLAYLKKEDYDSAIVDFEKALELNPSHELAKKNLQTALGKIKEPSPPPPVWQENGFRDMFFKFSGRLSNKYGSDPLGKTHNTNPDFDQNKIIKKPKKIVVWIIAGVILVSLGIVASIYKDRNLAREHNDNGLAYQSQKRYDEALEEFEQSIKLYPEYAEAYYNRGKVYYENNEYEKALTNFDKAMELDSKYTKIIESNKDYVETYFNLGEDHYKKGKHDEEMGILTREYDKALVYLDRAIELNPKYTKAYYTRGQVYNEKKEYDRALTNYTEAINLDSKHEYMYFKRGLIYFEKGDFDSAIDDYKKSIELDPKYAIAYYNRGKAYYKKKEYDKAMIDFDQAIELDSFWEIFIDDYPNCAEAYYNRGKEYMKAENYDRAIGDFTKVIKINPKNSNAYFNRGVSYGRKGNKDQAISDYMKAIELDPNEELYRNNLQNAL